MTNEHTAIKQTNIAWWLFRLMMFHETEVKGKTKAENLEVSGNIITFVGNKNT